MSKRPRVRLTVVSEDQLSESFVRRVFKEFGWNSRELRFETAPKGLGSGKNWVTDRYVQLLRQQRRTNYQTNKGLLVMSDVDELTIAARRAELDNALLNAELSARANDEKAAYWLPKWHVETWILHFLQPGDVDENTRYKDQCPSSPYWARIAPQFVDQYRAQRDGAAVETLPSLASAYTETQRIDP